MGTVESAITDLVKETVEDEIGFPSEEDIERTVESKAEEFIDRHLERQVSSCIENDEAVRSALLSMVAHHMAAEDVARAGDLELLHDNVSEEIRRHTFRYQVTAIQDKIKAGFSRLFTGRRRNTRKVHLWTVLF